MSAEQEEQQEFDVSGDVEISCIETEDGKFCIALNGRHVGPEVDRNAAAFLLDWLGKSEDLFGTYMQLQEAKLLMMIAYRANVITNQSLVNLGEQMKKAYPDSGLVEAVRSGIIEKVRGDLALGRHQMKNQLGPNAKSVEPKKDEEEPSIKIVKP